MSRIVFVEPRSPNLHIFSQFPLPRLGPFILGTIARQMGWDAEVIVEELTPLSMESLFQADLVGISTITSTAPRAYAIADRLREKGVPVILGGPHVTFLTDEALLHADFVVRGEGEQALRAFLKAWKNGKDFSIVPNLSYRTGEKTVHNPLGAPESDLDRVPYPLFSLMRAAVHRVGGKRIIPIQTSRGCPFHCSFCSVTGIFGKAYRFRSTENVVDELRQYDNKGNFIFFYDDNFTANPKRAKALLIRMIEERFRFKWSTQVRVDVAKDEELVGLMKRAGCQTLFIGMESVNPESLVKMKKQQTVDEMSRAIKILHSYGIHLHGMFVYGFDDDDWRTVQATVRFAKKARLSSTQFMILTPLPGSEFFNQLKCENRIQFRDWSLYDAHHAVFRPRRLSLFELQRAQMFSHSKFYSFMEVVRRAFSFAWLDLSLAVYARNLNRLWKKKNATFLKVMDLLKPKRGVSISIDYRETVRIDEEMTRAA